MYQVADESNAHHKEWAVKKNSSTRVSKYFKTKKEATEYIKGLQK
ncbi:DUF2188 domain-containing protein [Acholeplasma sp. OttesenSCG-928-E16]|nr:DUF2188 domain-containing protein [Acholeplasma sp. OttesenSCG-928-E16]